LCPLPGTVDGVGPTAHMYSCAIIHTLCSSPRVLVRCAARTKFHDRHNIKFQIIETVWRHLRGAPTVPRPHLRRPQCGVPCPVSHAVGCATKARTVRTSQILCRAYVHAVRRRAVRQVAPQNAGQNSLVSYFPRARALVRRRPAPTVAWIVPRVAHRHVRHDHAHRMRAAATLSRVWSRRAPPRGASGRAAERETKIRWRIISLARAPPCADVLRPLSRGSRSVSRTVVCAMGTRTVRALQAPCRVYGHAVRRRAVRQVAPRNAG
jgi:hypothetical protein